MKVRPLERNTFEAMRLLPAARAVAPVFPSADSLSSSPRMRISPHVHDEVRGVVPRRCFLAGLAALL
eukprot:1477527-Amphidinium_carterae.2